MGNILYSSKHRDNIQCFSNIMTINCRAIFDVISLQDNKVPPLLSPAFVR